MAGHDDASIFSHHGAHAAANKIRGWGIEPSLYTPGIFALLLVVEGIYDPGAVSAMIAALVSIAPIWLPIVLGKFLWIWWIEYIRYIFWFKQEHILLEIQVPQEVEKSPLAMEIFLTTLHNAGGETTFLKRVWEGSFRPIWALEIASNEGRVSFYIHMRKSWKNIIEARIYAQFPEAKITEIDDYTMDIPADLKGYALWGSEYAKGAPPGLPLKTYIDFKLDKDPKEEYRIDPIAGIIELLGQIGKGEHFWMQIVLKPRSKDEWFGFPLKGDSFKASTDAAVAEVMVNASKRAKGLAETVAPEDKVLIAQSAARGLNLLTEGEKRRLDNIERSRNKLWFECGVRILYLAKEENFEGVNIGALVRFFDAFKGGSENNSLGVTRDLADINYPWQDFRDIRQKRMRQNLFFRYKHRAYFYVPYNQVPVMLNTEELATIWHFPGSGVKTPGLNRAVSRRGDAPQNLPTI